MSDRISRVVSGTEPVFHTRVRIAHKQTASRGWEYDTTVEVAFDASESELEDISEQAEAHLSSELRKARASGERERNARNREDAAK